MAAVGRYKELGFGRRTLRLLAQVRAAPLAQRRRLPHRQKGGSPVARQRRADPLRRDARKKRRSPKPQARRQPQHRRLFARPPARQTRATVPLRRRTRARQRQPRVQNRLLPRRRPITPRRRLRPPSPNVAPQVAPPPAA